MRIIFIVLILSSLVLSCTSPNTSTETNNTNAIFFCTSQVLNDSCKKNIGIFPPKSRVYIHLKLETIPDNMQVEGKLYYEKGTNLALLGSQIFNLKNVEDVKFIDFIDLGIYQIHIVNSKGTVLTQGRVTVG